MLRKVAWFALGFSDSCSLFLRVVGRGKLLRLIICVSQISLGELEPICLACLLLYFQTSVQDQVYLLKKCVHLFNKYLLSAIKVPGMFLDIMDTALSKIKMGTLVTAYVLVILLTGH